MSDPPIVNLIGIGGKKCGTTLFAEQLSLIPEFFVPPQKEISYFCSEKKLKMGIHWYESNFLGRGCESFIVDLSVDYIWGGSAIASRILDYNPECEIFCLIRNPIDRALSHIRWRIQLSGEKHISPQLIADSINESQFIFFLDQYKNYFPNFIMIDFEFFVDNQKECVSRFCEELGIQISDRDLKNFKSRVIGRTINPKFQLLENFRIRLYKMVKQQGYFKIIRAVKALGLSSFYRTINSKPQMVLDKTIVSTIEQELKGELEFYLRFKTVAEKTAGVCRVSELV